LWYVISVTYYRHYRPTLVVRYFSVYVVCV
jgi:hypothetical protein